MNMASSTAATGWRSTASAAPAASRSSDHYEPACGTRHCGGLCRRRVELPLPLRSPVGSLLYRLPDRDDVARHQSTATGCTGSCTAIRGRILAGLYPVGRQCDGSGSCAELLPGLGAADWRDSHHCLWTAVPWRGLAWLGAAGAPDPLGGKN